MSYWIVMKGKEYYRGFGRFTSNRDLAMKFDHLSDAEMVADAVQGRVVKY